jgi:class 3 adenylate cyclase
MTNDFAAALVDADGRSEWIIVVVADIRGFSDFSTRNESTNIAMFIKRFYLRLINEYFAAANFVKPTGDGLLMTFQYNEHNLESVALEVIRACVRCLADFPTLCVDDPMINFNVPQAIGFGVARGTACCLFSGSETLDYSGHLLNLAARLNDLARPAGIVIDGNFQRRVLPEELRETFADEKVYVRGIADTAPITVMFQRDLVTIPRTALTPLALEQWNVISRQFTYRAVQASRPRYQFTLPARLKEASKLKVSLYVPRRGKKDSDIYDFTENSTYSDAGAQPELTFNMAEARKLLKQSNPSQRSTITFRIEFVPRG